MKNENLLFPAKCPNSLIFTTKGQMSGEIAKVSEEYRLMIGKGIVMV
jgi:hypothetical protein